MISYFLFCNFQAWKSNGGQGELIVDDCEVEYLAP